MPEHVKDMVDQNIDILNEPIEKLVDYVRMQDSAVQKDGQEQVAKHMMTMIKNNEINLTINIYIYLRKRVNAIVNLNINRLRMNAVNTHANTNIIRVINRIISIHKNVFIHAI